MGHSDWGLWCCEVTTGETPLLSPWLLKGTGLLEVEVATLGFLSHLWAIQVQVPSHGLCWIVLQHKKHASEHCVRPAPLTRPGLSSLHVLGLSWNKIWEDLLPTTGAPPGHSHWGMLSSPWRCLLVGDMSQGGWPQLPCAGVSLCEYSPCNTLELSEGPWWEQTHLSWYGWLSDKSYHNPFNNILLSLWEEIALSSSLPSSERQTGYSSSSSTAADPSWS